MTYPNDWQEKKLLDCVNLVQGLTYKPENVKSFGTLVLRSSNIKNNRLELSDNVFVNVSVNEEKLIQDGDILVCVRNGSSALIGKSCVLKKIPNTTFGAFMSVLRGDKTGFIAKIFESELVQKKVRNRSTATINQIMKKDFENIKIFLPPLEEQKKIAETLSNFDEYIDALAALIEKKKNIRAAALDDLMKRKIRLPGFSGDWQTYLFDDYFSLLPTNTYSRNDLTDRGKIGNIHYGDILIKYKNILTDSEEIPRLKYDSKIKSKCYLKINDVLFADTAEDETVGKAVQIGKISIPLVSGLHTVACCPNYETATGFLGYYLNSNEYRKQLYQYITGIKVSSISKTSFKKTKLHIPKDIEEQKAIAEILTAMDEEINALTAEREKIIAIRAGAMDELLTGKIRLK